MSALTSAICWLRRLAENPGLRVTSLSPAFWEDDDAVPLRLPRSLASRDLPVEDCGAAEESVTGSAWDGTFVGREMSPGITLFVGDDGAGTT